MPAVGGYEGAGEVHSVGSVVDGLSPGDLVMASTPPHTCKGQVQLVDSSDWFS